jgi:hypothetical protein
VTHAVGGDFDADFTSLRVVKINVLDFEKCLQFVEHSGFHGTFLLVF